MPLHTYRCTACEAIFETLVRGDDVPACPSCASTALERQVGTLAPDAKSKSIIREGRAQAMKEGHFSNYSKAERAKVK